MLNPSKLIQEYRIKQVQDLVEEDGGGGGVGGVGGGGLHQGLHHSITATMFLRNVFIRMKSCSDIMWNLFTRMLS